MTQAECGKTEAPGAGQDWNTAPLCADAFRWIDSSDIREHLRAQHWTFSDRDTAYLIWYCESISVEERHSAWRALMENSRDAELNDYLRRRIEYEAEVLALLRSAGGEDPSYTYGTASGNCRSAMDEVVARGETVRRIEISRRVSADVTVYAETLPNGTVIHVDAEGLGEETARSGRILNAYAFRFPCPFEPGELLTRINGIGIFAAQPLRFEGCRFEPGLGMSAECAYTDALGKPTVSGIPLLSLERYRGTP